MNSGTAGREGGNDRGALLPHFGIGTGHCHPLAADGRVGEPVPDEFEPPSMRPKSYHVGHPSCKTNHHDCRRLSPSNGPLQRVIQVPH